MVCFFAGAAIHLYVYIHIDHFYFFFFKQKTAYEMRISDWSSDVCSSDLLTEARTAARPQGPQARRAGPPRPRPRRTEDRGPSQGRRTHRRTQSHRAATQVRRARSRGLANTRPATTPPPPRHLRHIGWRLSVPRRRWTRQRRSVRRPGPLLRKLLRLRPLGPLRPRSDHRPERRTRRDSRLRDEIGRASCRNNRCHT